jgi:diguanylate cyclase
VKRAWTLRTRIAASFIALFFVVQVSTLLIVSLASYASAKVKVADELGVAERVFLRLLDQNAQQRGNAARGLVADFAFREAVASGDRSTLESALENIALRIGASGALFLDMRGEVAAGTIAGTDDGVRAALRDFVHASGKSQLQPVVVNGRAYQMVPAPVRSPVTVGWVVMLFPLDEAMARELRHLTNLNVTFVAVAPQGPRIIASTYGPVERDKALLPESGGGRQGPWSADMHDGPHQGAVLDLNPARPGSLICVIERPLSPALKYFFEVRNLLLVLGLAALALLAVISFVIARGITKPLEELLLAMRGITRGDYDTPVAMQRVGAGELGAVADGLDHLREGIRDRESRILSLAYEDALTGLPNRVRLIQRLQEALAAGDRRAGTAFLFVVGLDRFRSINDALGYAAGDEILVQVGTRLASALGDAGCVARLGGDEFAVLFAEGCDPELSAARIAEVFESSYQSAGQAVDVRASIGIARSPPHGPTAEQLLRQADVAMHAAKSTRAAWAAFDPATDAVRKDQLTLLSELQRAVERDELELFFQPKLNLTTGEVTGAEALLRWRHPERGRVPPGLFIPFAERTGYIRVLTRWVLRDVARQQSAWRASGISVQVAVNLSTRDFMSEGIADFISETCSTAGIPASCLRIEVTESGVMDDPPRAREVLRRLAGLGHPVSIDDYGTGYSSLAYLRDLPVDELKIDRAFISHIDHDRQLQTIVRSTADLAHGLGLTVVAEGVEEPGELAILGSLGCDFAQGYLMSPPIPAGAFEAWIRDRSEQSAAGEPGPPRACAGAG